MPGRVGALAASGASTVSRALDLVAERRAARRHAQKSAPGARAQAKVSAYTPLRVAAIALFVLAIGFLAYGFGQQLRGDPQPSTAHDPGPSAPAVAHTSVSPASLAAEARNNVLGANPSVEPESEPAPVPQIKPVQPKVPKTVKSATRVLAKVEAPAITPVIVVPPVVVVATTSMTVPTPAAAPDRWQMFSAALGRCNGNLFSKIACEHSVRAQYCDGYWGQAAQCPAGISNDHGQ
jgi:hypothetical protein